MTKYAFGIPNCGILSKNTENMVSGYTLGMPFSRKLGAGILWGLMFFGSRNIKISEKMVYF